MSSNTTKGWVIFIASLGMLFSMLSVDLATVHGWHDVISPEFVGTAIGHIGAVIAAFVGGKLIPAERDPLQRSRAEDVAKIEAATPAAVPVAAVLPTKE